MRIKIMCLCFCFIYFQNSIEAQILQSEVKNTGGGTATYQQVVYEWNIGESSLIDSFNGRTIILTNGFLQPFKTTFKFGELQLTVTNLLSPNGDGINDFWQIDKINEFPNNEIKIYDRNGQLVFFTTGYKNNWDGKFNGKPLFSDTYYYFILLEKGEENSLLKGFITIIN